MGGVEEFGVFDGLKLLVRIDGENQFEDVFLKLGGTEYQIHQLKNNLLDKVDKGILKDKKEYLLNFKNNSFVLSDSTLYGLQKGTALEGNRLAEIIGMEFGGNIQDIGNKVKGKFYYDNVNKFYYECIENKNLTYNDVTKFRAIRNKPISDRVGNLYKTKILKNSQIDSRIMSYFKDCYLIKQGNIAVFSGYLDPQFDRSINTVGKVLFRLPFAPISESWARPAFTLKTSGDVEAGYLNVFASNKITEPIHVNFSYICESEN